MENTGALEQVQDWSLTYVWNSNTSMDFMLEVEVDVMCVDIYALFNPVILCMDQCNYSWGFIDICMVWGSLVAL